MPSLPPRPSLEQLKRQAKDLHKLLKAGDVSARRRFREVHPRGSERSSLSNGEAPSLTGAQLVIAREYGFASWRELRDAVHRILLASRPSLELVHRAFEDDDAQLMRLLLEQHPEIKARINEPVGAFGEPAVTRVRSPEMLDVLLESGADINARSQWWAGGFGILHNAPPALAEHAIKRGATIDIHAAARLGFVDTVRKLLSDDPSLIESRGGDGQTPLHFASTVEMAKVLVERGAKINARDVDHASTPAQYMVRDRPEIARFLVKSGCETDLLLATALGDEARVRHHLNRDPECIRVRVSHDYFPMVHPKSGGTIYQWTLGWYASAHDVARDFNQPEVLAILNQHSPADVQFADACWSGDGPRAEGLLAENPGMVDRLSPADRRLIAHAARNNRTESVRVMLRAGFPVDARSQHEATPLHWAAFHGNAAMVGDILRFDPPRELRDGDFKSTPLGWAVHGSEHGWHRESGDYPAVVEMLLQAGVSTEGQALAGSPPVREILGQHGVESPD